MNSAHFHLLMNHVPILLSICSLALLVFSGMVSNGTLRKTAFTGFVLAAIFAIPVFLTGEPAEDAVEHLPGVTKTLIHEHEESAEFSIWMIEIQGVFSLLGLFFMEKIVFFRKYLLMILFLLGFIAAGSISYTGYLGGLIRHTEIRTDASVTNGPLPSAGEEKDQD